MTTMFISALLVLNIPVTLGLAISRGDWSCGRLVVFGDSFSDDGHGAWVASNGSWPSDPAYFGHSFSNGYVWNQDLAQSLDVPLLNYAAGGATADNMIVQGYTGPKSTIPVPSLTDQIDSFLSGEIVQPTDCFFIYIGANDPLFDPNATADLIGEVVESQVHRLYSERANQIILLDYPSLDLLPAEYIQDESTRSYLNRYTTQYNSKLLDIAGSWTPYLRIAVVRVSELFADVFATPETYGILAENVRPPKACLQGAYPSEGKPRMLCSDPSQHLFFDVFHPVSQIHARIAVLVGTLLGISVPVLS